jgi:prepilin-type N-terminal cleavage/methylation domain-containing protein/prepilin-type processing-associated H-X9-DG protein
MTTVGCLRRDAFTLIELLVVLLIVAVLIALAVPIPGSRVKTWRVMCMSNLRQVGLGLNMWSADHSDHFPWQLSVTNSGSMELIASGSPAPHFQMLSNYVTGPKTILLCPTDKKKKPVASTNSPLSHLNVSYFLNVDADVSGTNAANLIVAGDRHLAAGGKPVAPGIFTLTPNTPPLGWTSELHANVNPAAGNLLFLDGHVEFARAPMLAMKAQRLSVDTNRLAIP